MSEGDLITVCSECGQASCWQGIFLCDRAVNASTREMTVRELRALKLEHPSYWKASLRRPLPKF